MPRTAKNKPVEKFYDTLARYDTVGAAHEQAVKTAFHELLQQAAGKRYTVVPEDSVPGKSIRYDGVLKDDLGIAFGYWEAKDLDDDLEREIQKKVERGYSLRNTLFQTPERAGLYQDGRLVGDFDLKQPDGLQRALAEFIGYREPEIEAFHEAVREFKARIPELAEGLAKKIEEARRDDPEAYRAAMVCACWSPLPSTRAGQAGSRDLVLDRHPRGV